MTYEEEQEYNIKYYDENPNMLSYDMKRIRRAYQDAMHQDMPDYIADIVQRNLNNGYSSEAYLYAIHETAMAPKPSWRYTMAIMARIERERIPGHSLFDLW